VLIEAIRLLVTWATYFVVLAAALWILTWPVLWLRQRRRGDNLRRDVRWRWTAWLLAGAIVATTATTLVADAERRARVAKGRGDVLRLGKAVDAYAAHCGGPPPAGDAAGGDCPVAAGAERGRLPAALRKAQRNARGAQAGPFAEFIPRLPRGWAGLAGTYAYVVSADGHARVCGAGDGVVADSGGGRACP
jgi:hypothetical protein